MYTKGKLVVTSSLLICDEEARIVANCTPTYHVPKTEVCMREAVDNAKRLVLCWNTHEKLLEACKAALDITHNKGYATKSQSGRSFTADELNTIGDTLRAAISEAEAE